VCPDEGQIMAMGKSERKIYDALKSHGICVSCSIKPACDGLTKCETCRAEQSEAAKRNYAKSRSSDLCSGCRRNKPAPGMKMCASCRILSAAAARKRAAAKESSAAMCISREVDGLG